jgi:hypothetical protein
MKHATNLALVCLVLGACDQRPRQELQAKPTSGAEGAPGQSATAAPAPAGTSQPSVNIAGLGTCKPSDEVGTFATKIVELADSDANGQVSRTEAESAVNFVLGGFFFRADGNGDGKVTPEEGREARMQLGERHPAVAALLNQAREAAGATPFQLIGELANVNYDRTLSMEEARGAARSGIDGVFRVADTNKDDTITRAEVMDASVRGARALGSRAFAAADANHDQHLDASEFEGVIDGSVKTIFTMADANKDGRLSEAEAASAVDNVSRRLGLPAM